MEVLTAPGAQAAQLFEAMAAAVPAAHGVHTVLPAVEYWPAPHGVQADAPPVEMLPAAHAPHVVGLVAYWPAAQ